MPFRVLVSLCLTTAVRSFVRSFVDYHYPSSALPSFAPISFDDGRMRIQNAFASRIMQLWTQRAKAQLSSEHPKKKKSVHFHSRRNSIGSSFLQLHAISKSTPSYLKEMKANLKIVVLFGDF